MTKIDLALLLLALIAINTFRTCNFQLDEAQRRKTEQQGFK